jgi:hypothetical protein
VRVLLDANARLDIGAAALRREVKYRGDRRRVVVDDQPDRLDEVPGRLWQVRPDRDGDDRRIDGALRARAGARGL